MSAGTVVAGTAEAGGAECLIPAIAELRRRGFVVHAQASRRARHLFERAGMPFEYVSDEDAVPAGARLLARYAPDAVLTGLLGDKDNLDYSLIRAARQGGVPVVSILDSWMNYSDRLRESPSGKISGAITPDKIAVMDESALADMIAEGVPAHLCEVTGHPKFDVLNGPFGPTPSFRRRFGIAPEETVLTFFSHSTVEVLSKEQLGYVERDAVEILFNAVRALTVDTPIFLLFKEHPRAPTQGLDRLVPPARFHLVEEGDADELLLGSDVAASMASTMLVFAAGLGIPVMSIQPNLVPGEDRCVLTRRGLLEPVGSVEQFTEQFHAALSRRACAGGGRQIGWPAQDGRASARIADLVGMVVKERHSHEG